MSQTPTDLHDLQVCLAQWNSDAAALAEIRREVFVREQQVPENLEWDGEDEAALHWLALVNNEAVGTVRLLRNGHVGRMAVLKSWRQRGVGSVLLNTVIQYAQSQDSRELYLHAQTHALAFYERHGFIAEGPEFMDAGIPHRTMRKTLRAERKLGQDHGRFAALHRQQVALDLAQQTQRHIRILSNDLEPALYNHDEFARALSRLIRSYRNAEIRILIIDSRSLAQSNHVLLALRRRLNSAIQIRKISDITEPLRENYLVVDGRGLLCYSVQEPELAWADYNNVPLAVDYSTRFDELWNHAEDDPNLRVLSL